METITEIIESIDVCSLVVGFVVGMVLYEWNKLRRRVNMRVDVLEGFIKAEKDHPLFEQVFERIERLERLPRRIEKLEENPHNVQELLTTKHTINLPRPLEHGTTLDIHMKYMCLEDMRAYEKGWLLQSVSQSINPSMQVRHPGSSDL